MQFGIDFGTTHTVVAAVDRGNYPVVSFEHGYAIPSIVSMDQAGALHFGSAEPGWHVLRSIKRLLDGARPGTEVRIGPQSFTITELLARFLGHVREELVHRSNAGVREGEILEIAVGVPANASTAQRLITLDAYRCAGFEVKAVLNEPSAAGLEYAHRFRNTMTSKREHVLVYDLGGGTFDASLIRMDGRTNEVVTSSGVSRLGGDDFDEAIARLIAARYRTAVTPELLEEVRAQKEAVNPNTRRFTVDVGGEIVVLPIEEVYEACRPLVEQTLAAMDPAMRDPRRGEDPVPWSELAGIYVVGGASSLPLVHRRLASEPTACAARTIRSARAPSGSPSTSMPDTCSRSG
jgi:molecular chaperone DnaK